MFGRFDRGARHAVVMAQEEARSLGHNSIGTEHILLGVLGVPDGVGARVLVSSGVTLDETRDCVREFIGPGGPPPVGHIPFTPGAKKVLELGLKEAKKLGHEWIGTQHLLLGVIREGDGVGVKVLRAQRADLTELQSVLRDSPEAAEDIAEPQLSGGPRCASCRSSLATAAAYNVIDVQGSAEGDGVVRVGVAFCRDCGTTFGTFAPPD